MSGIRPARALAAVTAAGAILAVAGSGGSQVKAPADFALKAGEGSPGPVTFSHARHRARVERCTTCHARLFKMQRDQSGPMTMDAMQQGKLCGACHDGKRQIAGTVVFSLDGCDRCHRS